MYMTLSERRRSERRRLIILRQAYRDTGLYMVAPDLFWQKVRNENSNLDEVEMNKVVEMIEFEFKTIESF